MSEKFELIFGFIHCRGKTTYHAGFADTRQEAEAWVRSHREGKLPKMKIPPEDPVRHCQAALCPFQKQKPWFDFIPPS
jgi:hypothetical protein